MASAQLLPTKASLRAVSDEAMWSLVPSFLAIIASNHSPWQTLRGGGLANSSMHLQNGWTDGCMDSYPFGHFWFHWFSLINFHFKEIQRLDGLTFRWNKPNPKHQHRQTHYNWLKTFLTQLQTTNRLTLIGKLSILVRCWVTRAALVLLSIVSPSLWYQTGDKDIYFVRKW